MNRKELEALKYELRIDEIIKGFSLGIEAYTAFDALAKNNNSLSRVLFTLAAATFAIKSIKEIERLKKEIYLLELEQDKNDDDAHKLTKK